MIRRLIYTAPRVQVPSAPPAPFEKITFDLGCGTAVAWHHHDPALGNAAPVILYLHGNAENLETLRSSGLYNRLFELKAHCIALDYPGYGESTARPGEQTLCRACDEAVAWMVEKYPASRRIVIGHSLGAAAAIGVARRNSGAVDGLVAISAWTTLADVAARTYPRFLVNLLVADKYDSVEAIRAVTCPILLLHGAEDRLIPPAQGETLAAVAPALKRWVRVPGCQHSAVLDSPVVWAEIRGFVSSIPSSGGAL